MSRALLLLLVAACGGSATFPDAASSVDAPLVVDAPPRPDALVVDARIPDAGPDANPTWLACRALRQRWTQVVTGLSTECQGPADCRVVGKNGNGTCLAAPMLASKCDGDAVASTAYAAVAAELDGIAADFAAMCGAGSLCMLGELGCQGSCAPQAEVNCVHNTCVSFTGVCVPVDAGT